MLEAATKAYGLFDQRNAGLSEAEPYLPITAASGGTEGVIDDQFRYLLANNTVPNRIAFMAGTTKNEGGLFISGIPNFGKPLPNTEKEYIGVLESGQIAANDTIAGIIKDGTVCDEILRMIVITNNESNSFHSICPIPMEYDMRFLISLPHSKLPEPYLFERNELT